MMADPQAAPSSHSSPSAELARTPFHANHVAVGARMAPFAGYDMPVQYPAGIVAEHLWTRQSAGLFDVAHMGQALLCGPGAARALESLVPGDIEGLGENRTRYTQFLNEAGGILDDLMVTRLPAGPDGEERLLLVVNAARKAADFALLRERLPDLALTILEDRALLALQGPEAVNVLADVFPGARAMAFLSFARFEAEGDEIWCWRSGYTGEDGFEISIPAAAAPRWFERLLADSRVKPVGLGARDSLRLEAGLCLYGHDIDETSSPVEAGLAWSIGKRRRAEGGFPGFERIARELREGPSRRRVGLLLAGRQPAREGAEIANPDGRIVGQVTSGGFSPTLGRAIAMGFVEAASAAPGQRLDALVRGKPLPAQVAPMPFVPNRYVR
jgi:aminomethyltransferase